MNASGWRAAGEVMRGHCRVPPALFLLLLLVPGYVFLPELSLGRPRHAPYIALDHAVPLVPTWSLVYGALYLFLIVLPMLVVREESLLRRLVYAYLFVWVTAYVFFVAWPTVAPRPAEVPGTGYGAWGLRVLYAQDPPINCFPSLHVAHSFVSALAALRVHRRLGHIALGSAALVAVSTIFTKQHYVVDVLAGVPLAFLAGVLFLRGVPKGGVPALHQRAAPWLATGLFLFVSLVTLVLWVLHPFLPVA